jgi:hypothetical protein
MPLGQVVAIIHALRYVFFVPSPPFEFTTASLFRNSTALVLANWSYATTWEGTGGVGKHPSHPALRSFSLRVFFAVLPDGASLSEFGSAACIGSVSTGNNEAPSGKTAKKNRKVRERTNPSLPSILTLKLLLSSLRAEGQIALSRGLMVQRQKQSSGYRSAMTAEVKRQQLKFEIWLLWRYNVLALRPLQQFPRRY